MDRSADIAFMRDFREKVDRYLAVGYSPTEASGPLPQTIVLLRANKEYQALEQEISQMKARVRRLVEECEAPYMVAMSRPLMLGGATSMYNLLDLITRNETFQNIDKAYFLTFIDETIGCLEMKSSEGLPAQHSPAPVRLGFVFIAMAMDDSDPELEDVHNAIKEAASSVSLIAERIDDSESSDAITPRIIGGIESAQFMVADITRPKPNVYWEAGFAHGLGKKPIYIARQGSKVEFDIKDYPVIFFKNMTGLKRRLVMRLTALMTEDGR